MSPTPTPERRRNPRRKPSQLVYLEFGRENGGMIKDVSEGGMRFHLMNPVSVGQSLGFAVAIDATRRIEGQARMVWTDSTGKSGGLCFTELSAASRQILQAWLAEMDAPEGIVASAGVAPATAAPPVAISPVAAPSVAGPTALVVPAVKTPERESLTPAVVALPVAVPSAPAISVASPRPAASFIRQAPVPASPAVAVAPDVTTSAAAPELLEIGSQFIAQPVSREVWQRAAREEIAPGDRSRRPLAAAKIKAMREEVLASSQPSVSVEPINGHRESAVVKPSNASPFEAKSRENSEQTPDPLRDFLRQPIGGGTEVDARASEESEALGDALDEDRGNGKTGWTTPRLAMVCALAAICGVAAAFAGIAYRQPLGEAVIRLGEKISGEARPAGNAHPEQSPSTTGPGADKQSPPSPATEKPGNRKRASEPVGNAPPDSVPAANPPISQEPDSPAAHAQAALQQPATAKPQSAAGREIVPGKPRRPPEDVASLWIAVENGDTAAEILLANRYVAGDGVDKNCDQARVLLQAAVKHASEAAAKRLAQLASAGCE